MAPYYKICIGYNAASGGDAAATFSIDAEKALWFCKTYYAGLVVTESGSGFVNIVGENGTLTFSVVNGKEVDFEMLTLPTPFKESEYSMERENITA